jgi:hypothetical protein
VLSVTDSRCDAVYSTLSDILVFVSYQVPGFRPGKIIPENILINYVGPEHVQDATIETILKHTLPQALSSVWLLFEKCTLIFIMKSIYDKANIFVPSSLM